MRSDPDSPADGAVARGDADAPSRNQDAMHGRSPESRGTSGKREVSSRDIKILYLKTWMPLLLNPHERRKVVRYKAKYERTGLSWKADFPQQCWHCGSQDDLKRRVFQETLRSFEFPLHIVAGAGLALLFLGILAFFLSALTTLLIALTIIGIAWLTIRAKSWPEEVKLTVWTCPDHAEDLVRPPMVVDDDELHVYAPNDEIAEAANTALEAARRLRRRGPDAGIPTYDGTNKFDQQPAPQDRSTTGSGSDYVSDVLPGGAKKPELPPIKLDDDDAGYQGPSSSGSSSQGSDPRPGSSKKPELPPIKLDDDDADEKQL